MAYEYLNALSVSSMIIDKLRALGALSAKALLSKLEFTTGKSEAYLGSDVYEQVISQLKMQGGDETASTPLPAFRGMRGARMATPMSFGGASGDAKRDELSAAITQLRRSGDTSAETQERMHALEGELRDSLRVAG